VILYFAMATGTFGVQYTVYYLFNTFYYHLIKTKNNRWQTTDCKNLLIPLV